MRLLSALRYTGLLISILALSILVLPGWCDASTGVKAQSTTTSTLRTAASYSGGVYLDSNRNGIWDLTEEGMKDVSVSLEMVDGDFSRTTTSDEDGYYLFEDLPEGEYRVRVVPPWGYHITANGTFTISTAGASGPAIDGTGLTESLFSYLPLLTSSP